MRLGIHTSIGDGFDKAVQRLVRLGCNACQMFSRSPRGGRARILSPGEVSLFRDWCEKHDVKPVAIHIPYVLNLATSDPEMHAYAVDMVKEDMMRANLLGAAYLVLHMGSHRGEGIEKGLEQVAKALNLAMEGYDQETMLLLENTSGAGKEVGSTFGQLAQVLDSLKTPRAGICFDTCHGFAAGYDLTSRERVASVISEMDKAFGLTSVKLIHANDSMFPLGTGRDRHADIGKGFIGEEGFAAVINHPSLREIPFILETPANSDEDWIRNIETVRRLKQE